MTVYDDNDAYLSETVQRLHVRIEEAADNLYNIGRLFDKLLKHGSREDNDSVIDIALHGLSLVDVVLLKLGKETFNSFQEDVDDASFAEETRSRGSDYLRRPYGPYDRGAADSYYRRYRLPHYYKLNADGSRGELVNQYDMTPEEIAAYNEGYDMNEAMRNWKDYGNEKERY